MLISPQDFAVFDLVSINSTTYRVGQHCSKAKFNVSYSNGMHSTHTDFEV